jgi:hypothetical protein
MTPWRPIADREDSVEELPALWHTPSRRLRVILAPLQPGIHKKDAIKRYFAYLLTEKLMKTSFFLHREFSKFTLLKAILGNNCSKFWDSYLPPAAQIRVKTTARPKF